MTLFDISPLITPSLAVWPGDTPPSREILCDIKNGSNITLSTLHATVHLGSHADGPNHYGLDAEDIAQRPLDLYLGPCQLIRVNVARGRRVAVGDIKVTVTEPRVLVAMGTYPDPYQFNNDFAALAPELVDWLHDRGVRLV